MAIFPLAPDQWRVVYRLRWYSWRFATRGRQTGGVGKTSYFLAKCVNISQTVRDDLELYVLIFSEFNGISQLSDATTAKRMKIDQYCQRQRCKHVELQQFLACFRVARVSQRQLGFLVKILMHKAGKVACFSSPILVWRLRSVEPVRISRWNLSHKN